MPEVAVPPPLSAYLTVTCFPLAALKVTLNSRFADPLLPSVTLGDEIDRLGGSSSSVIVPVPVAVEMVAPEAALSCTCTVSPGSSRVSPCTATVTVLVVSPAANDSVPEASAV